MITTTSTLPQNINPLSPNGYRFSIQKLPELTYFSQQVNLPGITLGEPEFANPFASVPVPGDRLTYDALTLEFLVDEDMQAWFQVHDWIRALTFPTNFGEYINLSRVSQSQNIKATTKAVGTQFSDATVTLYSNKNNPKIRINIVDAFPTSLSSINLSAQDTADNIITADATFRFSYYEYERIS